MNGWNRVRGSVRPEETDTTSSKVYNYVHKNIEEKSEEDHYGINTFYEYDELMIEKEDWWIFEALISNSSDIADNREGIIETYEATEQATSDVADLREAVIEIYEMFTEEG